MRQDLLFLGTAGNEFYISQYNFFWNQAGDKDNGGDVVFNSRNGGTVYLNRDIAADVKISLSIQLHQVNRHATFLQSGNVRHWYRFSGCKLARQWPGSCAKEVKVSVAVRPDYVFDKNYRLPTRGRNQDHIDQNKHLPEVPSAAEMEKNGLLLVR